VITWPAPQIPLIPGALESVKVFDSTTEQIVDVAFGNTASLYVCGITPYDATHIGHAATYVAFDLLQRVLLDAGKEVTVTSNLTDVDDPLLERATNTNVDWRDLAATQASLFAQDMTALGVIPPATYISAVESIDLVVPAVSAMLENGSAYLVPVTDGTNTDDGAHDVYADVSADSRFGSVAPLTAAQRVELFAERGGDPERPGKRNALDALLWRAARTGEPAWDGGDLGMGRPGWHIECSVIAQQGLGNRYNVVGGGSDLLFPHHELSASHVRMITGDSQAGARLAVHAGLVSYQGEKMSKSRGNLVFVSRLRDSGIEPMVIRLALLSQHYRSEWEWTESLLEQAQARFDLWLEAFSGNGGPAFDASLEKIRAVLSVDLDAPSALKIVDDWARLCLSGEFESVEGAPGVASRSVNALLGIRL